MTDKLDRLGRCVSDVIVEVASSELSTEDRKRIGAALNALQAAERDRQHAEYTYGTMLGRLDGETIEQHIAGIKELIDRALIATQRLAHGDVIGLIERIVTGDGQQLENLSMSDDEWRHSQQAQAAQGSDDIDVTLKLDDWLALVKIAREANVTRV